MIIVPAFNEAERLKKKEKEWLEILETYKNCVLVDDGSTDNTAMVAKEMGFTVVRLPANSGKGAAIRAGILEGLKHDPLFLLFSDADLSCPANEWPKLIMRILSHSADIAIASRYIEGADAERVFTRELFSRIFNLYVRLILKLNYRDTQCGCKAFSRHSASLVFSQPFTQQGFAADLEILMRARKYNLTVREVPVRWKEEKGSKVKIFGTGIELAKATWQLKEVYGR